MTQAAQHPMIIEDLDEAGVGFCGDGAMSPRLDPLAMSAWSDVISGQVIGAAAVAHALLVPSVSRAITPITQRRKDRARIRLD